MRTWLLGLAACVAVVGAHGGALAQHKVTYGYTAVADSAAVFVAKEEGYFQKRGVDVELQKLSNTAVVVPGLLSNSLQMGQITAPVFLQAVDGGIDLVAISGLSAYTPERKDGGAVARAGSNIRAAADFVGKRVGVAGVNGVSQVLFTEWLAQRGVDSKKVIYVETSFPHMSDLLKSGNVDAVLIGGPLMNRILNSGIGYVVSYFFSEIPENTTALFAASSREWAAKNPAAITAVRGALAEAAKFVTANPEKARDHIGKYLGLSPELTRQMDLLAESLTLTPAQLQWWTDVMKKQNMLRTAIDASKLVAN
jgi:NitT/TauT family transport system substrate-binding protein